MTLIKMVTYVYVETDDPEAACSSFNSGAESQLRGFPAGDIVSIDVDHFEPVSDEEAAEKGLTE